MIKAGPSFILKSVGGWVGAHVGEESFPTVAARVRLMGSQ